MVNGAPKTNALSHQAVYVWSNHVAMAQSVYCVMALLIGFDKNDISWLHVVILTTAFLLEIPAFIATLSMNFGSFL